MSLIVNLTKLFFIISMDINSLVGLLETAEKHCLTLLIFSKMFDLQIDDL